MAIKGQLNIHDVWLILDEWHVNTYVIQVNKYLITMALDQIKLNSIPI